MLSLEPPTVNQHVNAVGWTAIQRALNRFETEDFEKLILKKGIKQMEVYSQYEKEIIDSVIDEYSTKTADELSDITHQKNSLWSKIVEKQKVTFVDGKSDVEIPTGYTKGISD